MDLMHLSSPCGWINDPNGFIYFRGKYHLFYQHFPYAPQWGRMHWGHAVSDDLIRWQHVGNALFPSKFDDSDGCFSGTAVEDNDKLRLFYTGVRYTEPNPENTNCYLNEGFVSAQMEISSSDGFTFDNFGEKRTVVPAITNPEIGSAVNTRDPKVWRGKDAWFMMLGTSADNCGRLLFYKSSDLTDWDYVAFAELPNRGRMWECPDYFELDGKGVLIISPIGMEKGDNQAICMRADFDEQTCTMSISENYTYLDYGMDLYAPQTACDKDGARTLIAWARMPQPISGGRIGMFCIPREISLIDGHIFFAPHKNILAAFTKKIEFLSQANCKKAMLKASLTDGGSIDIGGFILGYNDDVLTADRSAVFPHRTHAQSRTPALGGKCNLLVFIDENLVEVFVNDGMYVLTNVVYGLADSINSNSDALSELYTLPDH